MLGAACWGGSVGQGQYVGRRPAGRVGWPGCGWDATAVIIRAGAGPNLSTGGGSRPASPPWPAGGSSLVAALWLFLGLDTHCYQQPATCGPIGLARSNPCRLARHVSLVLGRIRFGKCSPPDWVYWVSPP